jgi:hypothetical protein
MRRSKYIAIASMAGVSLVAAVGTAFASHGKIGLWSVTVTMGGEMPKMPDMSKLPPDVQAKMKAMGVTMSGNTISAQHCMTAAEVATDFPKLTGRSAQGCTISNIQHDGHEMSADLTCAAQQFKGMGHAQFTFDSDTHYSGEVTMQGEANGHVVKQDEKLEGRWLSASCGNISN